MEDNIKRKYDFRILVLFLHQLYFKKQFKGTVEISSISGMNHHIKPRPAYGIKEAAEELKGYNVNVEEVLK